MSSFNNSNIGSSKIQEEILQILSEFDSFLDNVFETSPPLSAIPLESNPNPQLEDELRTENVTVFDKELEDKDVCKSNRDPEVAAVVTINHPENFSDSESSYGKFLKDRILKEAEYSAVVKDDLNKPSLTSNDNIFNVKSSNNAAKSTDLDGIFGGREELIDLNVKPKNNSKFNLFSNKKLSNGSSRESNDVPSTKIKFTNEAKERSKLDKVGTFQRLFCTSSSKLISDSDEKPKLTKPSGTLSKDQISYPILNETTLNVSLIEDCPNSLGHKVASSNKNYKKSMQEENTSSESYSMPHKITVTDTSSNTEAKSHDCSKMRTGVSVDITQKHKFDDLLKEFNISQARLRPVEKLKGNSHYSDSSPDVGKNTMASVKCGKNGSSSYRVDKPLYQETSPSHYTSLPSLIISPLKQNEIAFNNNLTVNTGFTSSQMANTNVSIEEDTEESHLLLNYLRHLLSSHSAKIAAGIMSVEHRGTKALELWTRRVTEGYDNVCITNMTTSWRDGLAFCALIHHFRPDLIDFKALKPENILENNALAFRIAEQHLGIPALLDAEDMLLTEIPDRLSILTYVSQFYQAFSALGLIGPGGRRSPVSPTATNNAKNSSVITKSTPTKQSSPIIPTSQKAKSISQPPTTLQTKTETGFKTDKVLVGTRARREECVACHKQVFLAERIVVGFPGQLRHRTCFRCDRCAAQLTLASYYETEKGQFCCETCPDEERNVYSGEDNDDDDELSISKSTKEGEYSSDSDASSDSDLEENTSLRYERRSKSRTPPPPSPRTLPRSRSKTPPPPSPRTVFLKESLQPSTTSPSDIVPPAKPPRSLIQDAYVSNFSEMSPALCGKNSQPPSLTLDNILTTTPISCDNAKGHETCQPCDTLDTGQNIQTDDTNVVPSSISQNKLLPNSNSEMKNEMQKEVIIENKVKSVRAIFEEKIVKSVENDKDKHAAKFILIDDKSDLDLESNVINVNPAKYEEANDLKNNKNLEFDEEKQSVAQKSSSDIFSTDMSIDSHSDDIYVDKPSLELPDRVLVCNVVTTSKDKLSSDSALESDASESHPVGTSEIPSIVISSDISIISDDKENQHGAISDSNIIVNNFDNKNTEDLDSNFDEKVDSKISSNLNRDIVGNLETKVDDNSSTGDSINAKSSNTEHMEASEKEYPDELNPFGSDDDENKVEKARPVKEFSKEVDRSRELSSVSPANIDKKNVKATPFNPFDSDEDEVILEENKEKTAPENAKKKSLNPFWSDEETEEESSPKKKVKPPRPPPPSLKYETTPNKKKYILPSSPYQDIPPPSPSLSSKSSSSDQSTLRLKKKLRQAPAPPSPALSSSLLSSSNETGEIKDEALSAKLQKDLKNHNSKLRGDGNHQRDDVSSPVSMKGAITTPKSERGEWRRKKGPAPSRPVPQKRAIRKLPMRQVAQELQDIEVKQTELERQGVILETAIRERTEGPSSIKSLPSEPGSPNDSLSTSSEAEKSLQSLNSGTSTHPSMEVEDMILQLFELVNEKNELFRRQTELMYLKREKRLEEEHAELEYQIRCLMLKHPSERTEEDGKIEEELISRLLKVVEQRDAVVNCLEMERQREAIEDESIAKHMIKYQEKHVEGIDSDEERERVAKKKKKKLRLLKKKKKKEKDREKVCKVDADKDIDETEVKKKKKNWFKKSPLSSVI